MTSLKNVWVIFDNIQCPAVSFRIIGKDREVDDCCRSDIKAIMFTGDLSHDTERLFQKLVHFSNMNMRSYSSRGPSSDFNDHQQAVMIYSKICEAFSTASLSTSSLLPLFNDLQLPPSLPTSSSLFKDFKLRPSLLNDLEAVKNTKLDQDIILLRKEVNEVNVVLRKDLEEASAKNTKLEQEIILLRKEFDDAKQTSLTFMNCLQSRINALETIPVAMPVAVIKTVGEELLYDS